MCVTNISPDSSVYCDVNAGLLLGDVRVVYSHSTQWRIYRKQVNCLNISDEGFNICMTRQVILFLLASEVPFLLLEDISI